MMKKYSLKLEFEKILQNKKYFIKFSRKNVSNKNYYINPVDPDGKKRKLINEEKYKLSQLKIINQFLTKELKKKKRKILDFGCGYGWLLKNLNKKYWDKFGIEINKNAREVAKKNGIKTSKFINNFKKKLDVAMLIHVIEHLSNPVNILKKIVKLIKKNGYLIIETPDFDSGMARKYNLKFRLLHDKTHISLFSTESLIRLVRDLGLKILKIEHPYFEGPFFKKKEINKLFKKNNKFSPPFYGSVVTIIAKK